jgi:tetratricopeptide (TPR) repeat protein
MNPEASTGRKQRFEDHRRAVQHIDLLPTRIEVQQYFARFLGIFLSTAGQMQESEATFGRLLMLNPQVNNGHASFAKMLLLKGDPEAALREAKQESRTHWRAYAMSLAYYAMGQNDKADETLAAFIMDYEIGFAYQIAVIYAFRGELIHHSDRGAQYLSDDFQALLKKHGISCSRSGAGSCYDNAAVESFFASLKRERVKRRKYRTRDQARADVFDYIERFYNRQRRHSYVGNISPVEFEERTVWT